MKTLGYLAIALLLLCFLTPAYAATPTCVSVQTTSTQVIAAGDVPLRHKLFCENIGGTNPAFCAIGTNNVVTATTGFVLTANAAVTWSEPGTFAFTAGSPQGPKFMSVPGGDVSCIATGGATTVCCSSY